MCELTAPWWCDPAMWFITDPVVWCFAPIVICVTMDWLLRER